MKTIQTSDTNASNLKQDFSRTSVSFYPSPYSLAGTNASTIKNNQSPYDIDENVFNSFFNQILPKETEDISKNNNAREDELKRQKTRERYVTFILGNDLQKEQQDSKTRIQTLSPTKNLRSLNVPNRTIQTSSTDQRAIRKGYLQPIQSASNTILSRKLETAKPGQRDRDYIFGQSILHLNNNHGASNKQIEGLSRRSPVLSIIIENRL